MKILAFTDTHADMTSLQTAKQKAHHADLAICLGDITWYGDDLHTQLELINSFPVPVLLLHGNHEPEQELRRACNHLENITFLHGESHNLKNFHFIAYGGDGFSKRNPEFEKLAEKLVARVNKDHHLVLLIHGPPHGTALDQPLPNFHSGSHSYREFIEKHKPLLVLAGHVHEGEKLRDTIGPTEIFNPGPDGEIIDLEVLHQCS